MERNFKKDKEKIEMYLGSKINAFTWIWEEFNELGELKAKITYSFGNQIKKEILD